jgi:hypothetical protein
MQVMCSFEVIRVGKYGQVNSNQQERWKEHPTSDHALYKRSILDVFRVIKN